MSRLRFLSRGDLPRLAYDSLPGRTPGIVFLPGYKSDMNNAKCLALEEFCRSSGQAFLRFDYRGCGSSEGNFETFLMGDWRSDTLAVLDELTTGPQILVGSSMGGWLMFLAAIDRPQRVAGLVSTGTAVDCFVNLFHSLSEEVKEETARKGFYHYPTPSSDIGYYSLTYNFLQEAEQHAILQHPIPVTCPVRMLHCLDDDSISWHTVMQVAEQLESRDVSVILRKQGGHNLTDSDNLRQVVATVQDLIQSIANN